MPVASWRGTALLCLAAILLVTAGTARAQMPPGDNNQAFRKFVADADYKSANFYIENGMIDPKTLDTAQIFFDVFMQNYAQKLTENAASIDRLYTYLNSLKPVDFNRKVTCGYQNQNACLLVDTLFTGAPRDAIDYFVQRGLDLNARVPGVVPATVPLMLRLGSTYSLDDLNHFVSEGLVLGDETYPINELVAYSDTGIRGQYNSKLTMPGNYLSLRDQNFLDVLVIALGTEVYGYSGEAQESAHRSVLCGFITYAAPSFTPSFDYLSYVLNSVKDFRGGNIGAQKQSSDQIFQPFPDSCVSLVQGMAASHTRLAEVVASFTASGDIQTARWLLSIKAAPAASPRAAAPDRGKKP
ncbi:MAG: hypothetical protein ACTHJ3_19450 [Pararhizobium sp.]